MNYVLEILSSCTKYGCWMKYNKIIKSIKNTNSEPSGNLLLEASIFQYICLIIYWVAACLARRQDNKKNRAVPGIEPGSLTSKESIIPLEQTAFDVEIHFCYDVID